MLVPRSSLTLRMKEDFMIGFEKEELHICRYLLPIVITYFFLLVLRGS